MTHSGASVGRVLFNVVRRVVVTPCPFPFDGRGLTEGGALSNATTALQDLRQTDRSGRSGAFTNDDDAAHAGRDTAAFIWLSHGSVRRSS